MIPAHLYNVPTLHHAFEFELLCNNVAARLLQGCHKVGNSFKSKVVSRLWTGSNNLVQQPGHKVATPLSQAWNFCMGNVIVYTL